MSSSGISIIVPIFNEAESLPILIEQLQHALKDLHREYEILLVDDCSTDGTRELVLAASQADEKTKAILLPVNTKKCGALREGIQHAAYPIVATLDADLQDDPSQLPRLLDAIDQGADCAIGWKKNRMDGPGKRIPSRVINAMCSASFSVKLHDMNSGFKVMTKNAAMSAPLFDSLYRYMAHFLAAQGFRVVEVPVLHRPRVHGMTKFGLLHRMQGIEDFFVVLLLVGLRQRRIFLWLLIYLALLAGVTCVSIAASTLFGGTLLSPVPSFVLGLFGLLTFFFGFRIAISYTVYRDKLNGMTVRVAHSA